MLELSSIKKKVNDLTVNFNYFIALMIQEGKVGKDHSHSAATHEMRAKFEMFSKSAHNSNQALVQAQNKSTNLVERIRSYTLIERGANKSQAL
jgi:hypothetical protein